jgi:hypothetical protein
MALVDVKVILGGPSARPLHDVPGELHAWPGTEGAARGSLFMPLSLAGAHEVYRIKLKEPAVGETAVYKLVQKVRAARAVGDSPPFATLDQTLTFTYRQTILEQLARTRWGTKLRRHYSHADRRENGKSETLGYKGMVVLIEKKGDKYAFRTEGGAALTAAKAEELEQEFNKKNASFFHRGSYCLLPKIAVRVGQSWTADPTPMLKEMRFSGGGMKVAGTRAEAKGRLLRAYKKDGRQFGVVELRFSVPILSLGGAGEVVKVEDSAWSFRLLLDCCIDGTSFAYRLKGVVEITINDVNSRSSAHIDLLESRQEAGKVRPDSTSCGSQGRSSVT